MAYNALTGTIVANKDPVFSPSTNGGSHSNAIHGEFHGEGIYLKNVARVVANDVNDYVVTLGNGEQSLVGEPNLRFNGQRLYVNAPVTASSLQLTDLSHEANPDTTVLLAIDESGNVFKSSPTPTRGPTYSVQFEGSGNGITGSSNFIFNPVSSSLYVSGAISGSGLQLTDLVYNESENTTLLAADLDGNLFKSDFVFNPVSSSLYVSGAISGSGLQLTDLPHNQNSENTTLLAIDLDGNVFKSTPTPSAGPIFSIQFEGENNGLSGSSNLTYNPNLDEVSLSGNLIVSGNIVAHTFDIIHTEVTEMGASGSTSFGNSNDDTHIRTGSFSIMSSSGEQFKVDIENKITSINTGVVLNRISTTTNYLIQKSNYIIGVDSTINPVTVTLPDASTLASGQVFVVKDEGGIAASNNITISASGSQLINGSTSAVLSVPYSSIQLYCNGIGKFFIF